MIWSIRFSFRPTAATHKNFKDKIFDREPPQGASKKFNENRKQAERLADAEISELEQLEQIAKTTKKSELE